MRHILGFLAALLLSTAALAEIPHYTVIDKISGPDGGWDYVSFDPAARRIYIARTAGAMALDVDNGTITSGLSETKRGHAALPLPDTSLVLSTDSGTDTAILSDSKTGAEVTTLSVGKGPDAAVYDPVTKAAWVMNGDSGDASVIDIASKRVVATVPIGGALEYAVADGKGRIYVNIEDKNELAVIDTQQRKVLAYYPLPGCEHPGGLAYNSDDNVLISACANHVAVLTGVDGENHGAVPIGAGPDAALYDPVRHLGFVPCGHDGVLTVIGKDKAGNFAALTTVSTQKGARTAALDPKTGRIYLPAANFGPPPAEGKRPAILPGSFQILVVAPQNERQ